MAESVGPALAAASNEMTAVNMVRKEESAVTRSTLSTKPNHSNDVNHSSRDTLSEDGSMHDLDTDVEKATPALPREPSCTRETNEASDLVEFDGPEDRGNPKNWSRRKRWAVTVAMGLMTFVITFASSIFSAVIDAVSVDYHVSPVVATLGVSLFLLVSASRSPAART